MRLIIYLASADPTAQHNRKVLLDSRSLSGNWGSRNLKAANLGVDDTSHQLNDMSQIAPTFFNALTGDNRNEVQIELVAHGEGGYRLKSFIREEDYANRVPPVDITVNMLKQYFDRCAFDPAIGQYKFNALTLYCCEGYLFAKDLSQSMPDVTITCFNEDIKVHPSAQAYPYKKEGTAILALDKNGNITEEHSINHHRCPLHVFHAKQQLEKTVFASIDAVPDRFQNLPNTVLADNSIEIIGNYLAMNQAAMNLIAPPQAAANLQHSNLDLNLLDVQNASDMGDHEKLDDSQQSRGPGHS